jgi:hypothetical protein
VKKRLNCISVLLVFCFVNSIFASENAIDKNTAEVLKYLNLSTTSKTPCQERLERAINRFFDREPDCFSRVILDTDLMNFKCKLTREKLFFEQLFTNMKKPQTHEFNNDNDENGNGKLLIAIAIYNLLFLDFQKRVNKNEGFKKVATDNKRQDLYYYQGILDNVQYNFSNNVQYNFSKGPKTQIKKTTIAPDQTENSSPSHKNSKELQRNASLLVLGASVPCIVYYYGKLATLIKFFRKLKSFLPITTLF